MNYKVRLKVSVSTLFDWLKPVIVAMAFILVLQLTGLMSSVSYLSQWALLQSGLNNAGTEKLLSSEDFDYQFTIKDLEGSKHAFDQFKGKVVFLNLWATWCGPCRAEMPGIQKLYSNINNEKIIFVMLSIDRDRDIGKVKDYLKDKGFTFPAFMPSGYLTSQLNVPSIPTTFVISKEGKIVRKEIGTTRYDTPKFQKFLEDLSQ